MLKLLISGNFVEVRQNGDGLYCLNDIFRASGFGDSKQPSRFLRGKAKAKYGLSLQISMLDDIKVTFAPKQVVYKYSAWIDDDFYDAVFEAFEAASEGDAKKAVDIATSVAIPQELIDREKKLRNKMNELIEETFEDTRKRTNAFTNYNRLIAKCVSGYTPKELTDGIPTFKYIVENGHLGGVSAYLATLEMINTSLVAGLDYQTVALMLQVETTKNKKLLKQVKVI